MNKNVFSQLAAEFEKMEKTIEFQSKIIKAATAHKSAEVEAGRLLLGRDRYVCSVRYG